MQQFFVVVVAAAATIIYSTLSSHNKLEHKQKIEEENRLIRWRCMLNRHNLMC